MIKRVIKLFTFHFSNQNSISGFRNIDAENQAIENLTNQNSRVICFKAYLERPSTKKKAYLPPQSPCIFRDLFCSNKKGVRAWTVQIISNT